jgi:hypothetical protein
MSRQSSLSASALRISSTKIGFMTTAVSGGSAASVAGADTACPVPVGREPDHAGVKPEVAGHDRVFGRRPIVRDAATPGAELADHAARLVGEGPHQKREVLLVGGGVYPLRAARVEAFQFLPGIRAI